MTDYVIIYEHCHCIHEMIKELEYWIKKAENGENPSYYNLMSAIDMGKTSGSEEED